MAQFPTNVHLDLLAHKLIPDPFIGKNELLVQWVGESQWVYKTTFSCPAVAEGAKAVLAFDGLDTFATVVLNGEKILETDNMFLPERVDVTSVVKEGDGNELAHHVRQRLPEGLEAGREAPRPTSGAAGTATTRGWPSGKRSTTG